MKSKKFNWEDWLDNSKKVLDSFNFYLKKEMIKKEEETEFLSASHLKKAEYNLMWERYK